MAALALAASAIGTIIGTVGAVGQGNAANEASKFEAIQMQNRANEARAIAQRQAGEQRLKTDLTQSRLKAVASTTTGDATDPTVINLAEGIQKRGEYFALSDWAAGENRARGYEDTAAATRFKGQQAQTAGYMKGAGTLFDGIGNFYKMYNNVDMRPVQT